MNEAAGPDTAGSASAILDLWRSMYELRLLAQTIEDLFARGLLVGGVHLAIGQEATAVGVVAGLDDRDWILPTYRGLPYVAARGADLEGIIRELMTDDGGLNGGRAGTKHLWSERHRVGPGNAIVAGSVAIGAGLSFAASRQQQQSLTAVVIGDGAMNQGVVYEALNMAAILEVPYVLVCENNGYGEMTPVKESTAGDLCARARSFGAAAWRCDGNDVLEVTQSVAEARALAVTSSTPVFVESVTYRQSGHMIGDARAYRSSMEEARWLAKDPIAHAERLLATVEGMSDEELARARNAVERAVQTAREAALRERSGVAGAGTER